jgi:ankyrin repeat protein
MANSPLKNAFPPPPFSREDVGEFCQAGKTGDVEGLKRILEKFGPAILNERESNGDTALTWACWTGKHDAAKFLLDSGANIEAPGMQGKTPLIWAAQGGRTDVVRLLLKRGANINAQDDQGQTALKICDNNAQKQVAEIIRNWVDTQEKIAAQKKLEEESRALTTNRLAKLKDKAPKIKLGPKR